MNYSSAQRQMEFLDRGLVGVPSEDGTLLSWRLLGTDPDQVGFHVFEHTGSGETKQLSDELVTKSTNFWVADPRKGNA